MSDGGAAAVGRPVIGRTAHDWGTALTGFGRPFGLGVDAAGRLLVTDMDLHLVARLDPAFERVQWHDGGPAGWSDPVPVLMGDTFPAAPAAPGAWNGPHSVDVDAAGRLYVTCYRGAAIHRLSPSGAPDARLGAGVLTGPATAFLDGAGHLLVAEYRQSRVLRLGLEGGVEVINGRFDRPHMARRLADGAIVVADTWHDRVQRFDADGVLIDAAWAIAACPVAIDPGPDGSLLVTAWGDHSVISFDRCGGSRGRLVAPALERPYDARHMDARSVVADSHHGRVLVIASPRFQG